MTISRRKFVKISSLSSLTYFIPFPELFDMTDASTLDAASLYKSFKNPPDAARPFVRWWWNGGRITGNEIIRELDQLKAKGISGVEINTIAFPKGNDPKNYKAHSWLGKDWLDLLKKAVNAAKERGITCDIIAGSGWPFGGEFLEKQEQIQMLTSGTKLLKGPKQYKFQKKELLDEMDFLLKRKKGSKELYEVRLSPAYEETFDPGIKVSIDNEEIIVDVPAGDYTLHSLVKLTGYTSVTHGAPGASGPVLNHYNKAAVKKYLYKMSDAINSSLGSMGDYFRAVFVDSLELRGSNWCDDLVEEFKERRGYSLESYLPFILFKSSKQGAYRGQKVVDDDEMTKFSESTKNEIQRVRYDFEITRLELFNERFLETFVNWCKENKVKSRVQAYGREYYPMKSAMEVDIPECESWLRQDVGQDLRENTFSHGRAYRPVNKFVTSAAWLTNKRIVSCEEITNTKMVFNATLENIKVTGDQSNLSGVNHSILHGFNYSPANISFPGWVRYGTFFNERNTWWPYLKTWIDYKARLSTMFQAAEMQSDTAIMFPLADMWSEVGLQYQQWPKIVYPEYGNNVWEAIHQNGGGCDYITENILEKASFKNGKLHYGPRSYKILMMLEIESVSPETTEALIKFAKAGGCIIFIGKEPIKSHGLLNDKKKDVNVQSDIQSLKKTLPQQVMSFSAPKGKIIDWFTQIQGKLNITPYVKFDRPASHVSQNYYKTKDADIFFISNYHLEKSHNFTATFNIQNKTAWVWDPETGEKFLYPYDRNKNRLKIKLDPAESLLIVFTDETKGELYPVRKVTSDAPYMITGGWEVTLDKFGGNPRKVQFPQLIDFKEDKELKTFGGTIIYEKKIDIKHPRDYHYLDLGKVNGISEVELNGQGLGFKWYGKHIYDTKSILKSGKNSLKIKITTTLGNYAKSLKDNKVAQQWTKNQPVHSQGLLGPVSLK